MATWAQDPSEQFGRFRRGPVDPEPDDPPPKPRFPHDVPIRAAGLSCDRKVLVALDAEGFVNGWDAVTARRLYRRPLIDPKEVPQRLTFSPDGRFVALSPRSLPAGLVRVLDPGTGKELRRFDSGFSPSFSPDSALLACSDGKQLRRWSLKNGAELPRFPEAEESLKWTAWSPKDNVIAASSEDSPLVAVWDAATGERSFRGFVGADREAAASIAFSPDGRVLAVGSHWGIRFNNLGGPPEKPYHGHEEYALGQLKFSSGGRRLAAMSRHRRLLVWDTFTGKPLFTWASFQTEDGSLEISEGGDVAIWIERGGMRLERIPELLAGPEDGHVVRILCFTPAGQVVTGDEQGMVRVWDPATQLEIRRHAVPKVRMRFFSRNGAWAIFGGIDDPIGIWDLDAGKEILKVHPTPSVWSVALSPDGGRLALGHADGTVSLWSVAEKRELARIGSEMSGITAVSWSTDGKSLAWGDDRGAVSMAEGKGARDQVRFRPRSPSPIRDLRFTADGRTLMATDAAGQHETYAEPGLEPAKPWAVLQNLPELSLIHLRFDPRWRASGCFQKDMGVVRTAISPDGSTIAGATKEGNLVIWEAPGGK